MNIKFKFVIEAIACFSVIKPPEYPFGWYPPTMVWFPLFPLFTCCCVRASPPGWSCACVCANVVRPLADEETNPPLRCCFAFHEPHPHHHRQHH